jgi:hypothetical protein
MVWWLPNVLNLTRSNTISQSVTESETFNFVGPYSHLPVYAVSTGLFLNHYKIDAIVDTELNIYCHDSKQY